MKIFLTRHGETVGNVERIHEGARRHGKLSILGSEQVKKLAIRLKDEKFDCAFSSDLRRARQTAREILRFHPKTPIEFSKELREADVGSFSGKNFDSVDWSKPPKNIESKENVRARALDFIDRIYKEHKKDSVLLVAHSYFNKALISGIMGKDISAMNEIDQKNTCVNIIEIYEDKKHKIHLLNCIKHLKA